jgi:ADP-ribose pyrophosphatase
MEVPLEEALQWVREGRITEVKSIIGLMWAEKRLAGAWARR